MSPDAEDQSADDALAAELGAALAAEHDVPEAWRTAARGAYAWRNVDQELMALTYDSSADRGVAVRGTTEARVLEFTGGALSLEVELVERRVTGRLTGPGVTDVVFESADGRVRTAVLDASGFFTLDGEDHGLVRFAVGSDQARHVTEWILL